MITKTEWQLLVDDQDGYGMIPVGSPNPDRSLLVLFARNYEDRRDKRKKKPIYYIKRIETHEETDIYLGLDKAK